MGTSEPRDSKNLALEASTKTTDKELKSQDISDLEIQNSILKKQILDLEKQGNKPQVVVVFNIMEDNGGRTQARSPALIRPTDVEDSSIQEKDNDDNSNVVDSPALEQDVEKLQQTLQVKQAEIHDIEMELQSIKDEFVRFRKQSESNAKEYEEKVETLSEQLVHLKTGRGLSTRTFLDSFPENESGLIGVSSSLAGTSLCDDSHSIDVDHSVGHESSMDDMEDHHKKIYQLTQSLRSMGVMQKDLQRRLVDAQEERDYFKSVTVDLQQQVDASSPDICSQLRAMVQTLEDENKELVEEIDSLQYRLNSQSFRTLESRQEVDEQYSNGAAGEDSEFFDHNEGGGGLGEQSEELLDCTFDIMGEMANAASETELGISLSYVQYAGLLSAIQKAIKQLDEAKVTSEASTKSFRALDRSLSSTLHISSVRLRGLQGEGQKRVGELATMMKEREAGLRFMQDMLSELQQEMKGHESLSLQQEVQIEYLKQHLSNPDRVIQLTWEVESLKQAAEDNQRELKALRDLQDQQQQELTIQWQSKQKAVAEKLSQHHAVSSYSQQLEHIMEVNEAMQVEKTELEDALQEAKNEAAADSEKLCTQISAVREELESERLKPQGFMTEEDCQGLLTGLSKVDDKVQNSTELNSELLSSLLKIVVEVQEHFVKWKEEIAIEKMELSSENGRLVENLKVVEGLKSRVEQEKQGLQEILSLTVENTSQEMATMQNNVQDLGITLTKKEEQLQQTLTEVSKQKLEIQAIRQSLRAKEAEKVAAAKELDEKLHIVITERAECEDHMRSYKQAMSELNKDLASYETRLKEASKSTEVYLNSFRLEQEKTGLLEKTVQELIEQITEWKNKCGQLEKWKNTAAVVTEEKQDLQKQRQDLKSEARLKDQEITILKNDLAEVKTKMAEFSKQRLSLQEQISTLKQQLADESALWEAEFAKIGDLSISRDQWPQPVVLLVEHCETQVSEKCHHQAIKKGEEMHALLQKSEEKVIAVEMESKEKLEEVEDTNWYLQEKIENLQTEMKGRESTFKQEIEDLRESSENKIQELTGELEEIKEQCIIIDEEKENSEKRLQAQIEEKTRQMREIQEKARELMKEKEKEISELKQSSIEYISPDDEESSENPAETDPDKALIQALRKEIIQLQRNLVDSDHTHELRDRACQVLKEEIYECERSKKRESVDTEYLKNVLVNAFEKGTLPKESPMLTVIGRILHFSPEEKQRIHKMDSNSTSRTISSNTSFLSGWL